MTHWIKNSSPLGNLHTLTKSRASLRSLERVAIVLAMFSASVPVSAQISYPSTTPAGVAVDQFAQRGFGALTGGSTPWDAGSICGEGYVRGVLGTCVPDPEREHMLGMHFRRVVRETRCLSGAGTTCFVTQPFVQIADGGYYGARCSGTVSPPPWADFWNIGNRITQMQLINESIWGHECGTMPDGRCNNSPVSLTTYFKRQISWRGEVDTDPVRQMTIAAGPPEDSLEIGGVDGPWPCLGGGRYNPDPYSACFGPSRQCDSPNQVLGASGPFAGREPRSCVGDPIDLETGAFVDRLNCGNFDNPGPDLDSSLTYNSRRANGFASVPLPAGWTVPYSRTAIYRIGTASAPATITVYTDTGDILRFARRSTPLASGVYPYTQSADRLKDGWAQRDDASGKIFLNYRDGSRDTFTSRGDLEQVRDVFGNAINISYTAGSFEWVRKLTHSSSGQAIEQVYSYYTPTGAPGPAWYLTRIRDAAQNIAGVTGAAIRTAQIGYGWSSTANRSVLVSFTDYTGRVTRFGNPDSVGRPQRRCDENNSGSSTDATGCVTHTYDSKGRVTRQIQPDGSVIDLTWATTIPTAPTATDYTLQVDWKSSPTATSSVRVRRYLHDRLERHRRVYAYDTNASYNRYSERIYDGASERLLTYKDESGLSTSYRYDPDGHLIAIVEGSQLADPAITRFTDFDSFGQPRRITDAEGRVVRRAFNATTGALESETVNDGVRDLTTSYFYFSNGQLQKVVQPDGTRHVYSYDARKYPDQIAWDANDSGAGITGRLNLVEDFTFDWRGFMVAHTDKRGVYQQIEYDAVGRPIRHLLGGATVSASDPLTTATRFEYENAGALKKITQDEGGANRTWQFTNVATSIGYQPTSITAPNGLVTTRSYDAAGRLTAHSVRNVLGTGTIAAGTSDNHRDTTYSYLREGSVGYRVITTNDRQASKRTYYGPDNRPVQIRDERGHVTLMSYDDFGRLKTVTEGAAAVQSWPAVNAVTTFHYDKTGRLIRVVDSEQQSLTDAYTQYEYDGLGRLQTVIDATGRRTSYTYDPVGRTKTTIHGTGAESRTVRETFDRLGRLLSITTDPGTGRLNLTRTYGYGNGLSGYAANRWDLGRFTDELGHATQYAYNKRGDIAAVGRLNGLETWRFEYNRFGQLTRQSDALGHTREQSYDPVTGLLTTVRDNNGTTIQETLTHNLDGTLRRHVIGNATHDYRYNTLSQMIDWTSTAPGAATVSTQYDWYVHGPLVWASQNGVSQNYGRDAADRLISDSNNATLNRRGQPVSFSNGSRTATYEYDAAGRLITLNFNGQVSRYVWAQDGSLQAIMRDGPAVDDIYSYDTARRLVSITPQVDGVAVNLHTALTLDSKHQAIGQRLPNGSTTNVSFDPRGMASNTGANGTLTEQLGPFDHAGNPTHARYFGFAPDTAALKHERATLTSFSYDSRGNLLSAAAADGTGRFTFTYDARDRLVGYTAPNDRYPATATGYRGNTRSFGYSQRDVLNRIVNPGVGVTRLKPSHMFSLPQSTQATNWNAAETVQLGTVDYAYDPTGLGLYSRNTTKPSTDSTPYPAESGTNFVPIQDQRGSVWFERATTASATQQSATYTLNGELGGLPSSAAADPTLGNGAHRFAGEWQMPHGLTYLRARWYFPQIGRFLQRDKYVGNPFEPSSLNRYVYAEGDPINKIDPSGYFADPTGWADFGAGTARTVIGSPIQTMNLGQDIVLNGIYDYLLDRAFEAFGADMCNKSYHWGRRFGILPLGIANIVAGGIVGAPRLGRGTLQDPEVISDKIDLPPMRSASPQELSHSQTGADFSLDVGPEHGFVQILAPPGDWTFNINGAHQFAVGQGLTQVNWVVGSQFPVRTNVDDYGNIQVTNAGPGLSIRLSPGSPKTTGDVTNGYLIGDQIAVGFDGRSAVGGTTINLYGDIIGNQIAIGSQINQVIHSSR